MELNLEKKTRTEVLDNASEEDINEIFEPGEESPKKDSTKSEVRKAKGFIAHLKSLGFTNRLAIVLVIFLLIGLIMGFVLALLSIFYQYLGQLICFTAILSPIGTACSIVLNSIVNKSKAENLSGDGTGIKFAAAMADNFCGNTTEATPLIPEDEFEESPPI